MSTIDHKEKELPLVMFDGVCNMCNSAVQFIIERDTTGDLRFASLQSDLAKERMVAHDLPPEYMDSFLLIEDGVLYSRSTAALRISRYFGGLWKLMYAFIIVPAPIRDGVYNFIGRNRYKWFGKKDQCMMPTPEQRAKFVG